jgi:hypothetical protein
MNVDGGNVAVNRTSWRMKSTLSIASETECSVRLNGSQRDYPRGRGIDDGGDFRLGGSTVGAHEVCIPMIIRHEPEIVSPWVGNEVSVNERHQPADLSAM